MVFQCINICQVTKELWKTKVEGHGFQQPARVYLAKFNALKNYVCYFCINLTTMPQKKCLATIFQPHHHYLADSYTDYTFL